MSTLSNTCYEQLSLGQKAQYSKTLTKELVKLFAAVSGDLNPVHLDEAFAKSTMFGEPIGHGAWVSSLVSAAVAMNLPGPGTIYRSQQISFKEPARIGDTLTVNLEVAAKKDRIRLVVIDFNIVNEADKTLAKGSVEVIAPVEPITVDVPAEPKFALID